MPRFARVGSHILGLAIPLLAGCASAGVSPARARYRPEDFQRLRDSVEAVAAERASEPRVRIITPALLGADRFVESAFRVSEDAYVVIVAVDYDGFARVVFPESPSETGFVKANTLYKLPTFFAGFGSRAVVSYAGSMFARPRGGGGGSSGLIFAVASERPLQLQRLATNDGDWNEWAIEDLLWGRSYNSGAYALGRVLALTGQEFDTDFAGFTQGQGRPAYMFASLSDPCHPDARSVYEQYYQPVPQYGIAYVEIDGIQYARIAVDHGCGSYTHQLVPVGPVRRTPPTPVDSTGSDSSAAESATRRAPHVGTPVDAGSVVERPVARQGTIGSAGEDRDASSYRRPMIDRSLRFQPPERVREEGRVRGSGGESVQEELARDRGARRAAEEQQRRTAAQNEAANARPTRQDPPRSEPAAIERTTSTTSPAGGQPAERTGKPIKE